MASTSVNSGVVAAVRARLAALGMQQQELALRAGVHKSLISQVLSGDRRVTQDLAVALANALGEGVLDAYAADLKRQAAQPLRAREEVNTHG